MLKNRKKVNQGVKISEQFTPMGENKYLKYRKQNIGVKTKTIYTPSKYVTMIRTGLTS